MNPLQMAKAECDCYNPDGSCLGITLNDSLKLIRFRPENSPCLLNGKIQRCQHFEQAILPHKPEHKDSRVEARLQADWNEGSHQYRIKTGFMASNIRLCPQCQKNKISDGRKLCDLCKAENRRKTKSTSDSKRNPESNSHSSSISDLDSQ